MAREGEFNPNNPYRSWKVWCPKSLDTKLKEISKRTGIPVSHLVMIAVDNELDAPAPFAYPCELPSSVYIEGAYMDEAQRIATFLTKFKKGIDRKTMMYFRRDVGIDNRETLMLAIRELMEVGVLIEVPPPVGHRFRYSEGHKFLRLKHIDKSKELTMKKRLAKKLQEEIEQEEALITAKEKEYKGEME